MKTRTLTIVTLAAILLLAAAGPAAASPSLPVMIEVHQGFDEYGTVPSPFYATGPAVDAGLMCPEGLADNLYETITGPHEFEYWYMANFHTTKLFVCADGSGSFTIKFNFHQVISWEDEFVWDQVGPWRIAEGTGAYERLKGTGEDVSLPWQEEPFIIRDEMTGKVHID